MTRSLRPAYLLLPLVAATLLLFAACGDESSAPAGAALEDQSPLLGGDTTVSAPVGQILRRHERFRVFSTMLDSARLLSVLRQGGPYTVFAATDPGIGTLPEGLVDELLLPANRERLRQVMAHHLHRGPLSKDSLRGADSVATLSGHALAVAVEGGRVLIGGERVSEYAITGTNGRIFAFDAPVIPPVGPAPADLPAGSVYDTAAASGPETSRR